MEHNNTYPSVEQFEALAFEPEQFDHTAHVYVGWSYLQRYDLPEAASKYRKVLRRLTDKLHLETKYNETITWFFLVLIAAKVAEEPEASWQQFARSNRDLCEDGGKLLRQHYSKEFLQSPAARQSFLLPDR